VQLAAKDRYLALLDPKSGKLGLRAFDAEKRSVGGSVVDELAIKDARAMIGSDARDDRLYVVTSSSLRVVRVGSDGKLAAASTKPVTLKACPALACGQISMHEVGDGRVVVAREALDQVDLVDLNAKPASVKTASVEAPVWLDVPPRGKDRVIVAHHVTTAPKPWARLCVLEIVGFGGAGPACAGSLTTSSPISVTVVPEETHALMTLGGVLPSVALFNLKTKKFEPAKTIAVSILPHAIAIQP
jgi:hypothetical protein